MSIKLVTLVAVLSLFAEVSRAQLTLSAGQSYTYTFDSLNFFGEGYTGYPPSGLNFATFSSDPASQDPGDSFLVEIFENSTGEAPLASNSGLGTVTAQANGGWHDLQGFARVTVTSGTLTLNTLSVGVYRPTLGIPGEFEFYNSGVVPVPEPASVALWTCALASLFFARRRFRNRRSD